MGKGDKPRPVNKQKYDENFQKTFDYPECCGKLMERINCKWYCSKCGKEIE